MADRIDRGCRNPNRPCICLCPMPGRGYGPRQVLASTFINGWLGEGLTRAANKLAADESVSEERLWRMLFTLEDEASAALEMWRACQ
jgi:hypothetical protein